jgi:hypothetical protein
MSGVSQGTVSEVLEVRLVGPDELVVERAAGLRYSGRDPYAVRVSFGAGLGGPVEWVFGRDLLAAGLEGPAGIGDVRAWPSEGPGGGEKVLVIVLAPPEGSARFEAGAAGIGAFLARTFELVPAGQESGCLDLDAELAELLSQA